MTFDFTHKIYRNLLQTLLDQGFSFQPFEEYLNAPATKVIILRHDVDKRPHYALSMARLEHDMGIRGTYYFRCVPQSWNEAVMRQIATLGHEIGYHYEDLSIARGNYGVAIQHFLAQLKRMRQIYPTKTICMHGSPLSKYDNRDLWNAGKVAGKTSRGSLAALEMTASNGFVYDYRDYGIIGEPYFDVDFTRVLYLTDTGRRWDGDRVSVRDKTTQTYEITASRGEKIFAPTRCRSTHHIIAAARANRLANQIMLTIHPQRWTDKPVPWLQELLWQNVKNVAKWVLVAWR